MDLVLIATAWPYISLLSTPLSYNTEWLELGPVILTGQHNKHKSSVAIVLPIYARAIEQRTPRTIRHPLAIYLEQSPGCISSVVIAFIVAVAVAFVVAAGSRKRKCGTVSYLTWPINKPNV